MDATQGREWLELLLELAPRLRAEGVYKVSVGPLVADLAFDAPAQQQTEPPRQRALDEEPPDPEPAADPLDDGSTYGTDKAPGYEALRR